MAAVPDLDHPSDHVFGDGEVDEVVPPGSEQEEMGVGVVVKFPKALFGKLGRHELVEDPEDEVRDIRLLAALHQPVLQRQFHPPPLFSFLS